MLIINGPNLNLLGQREQSIYGNISFETYLEVLRKQFKQIKIDYYQSNIEGELIDKIQSSNNKYDYILLNAGGYTHTSVAITDTVAAIKTEVVEIHITNIYNREEYRSKSLLSSNCRAVVCGFGLDSYKAALVALNS